MARIDFLPGLLYISEVLGVSSICGVLGTKNGELRGRRRLWMGIRTGAVNRFAGEGRELFPIGRANSL